VRPFTLRIILMTAVLAVPAVASAGEHHATPSDVTAGQTSRVLEHCSQHLSRIDSAFSSGALTFQEAKRLYAEHATIWAEYLHELSTTMPAAAAEAKLRFMLETAEATLARLMYNQVVRVDLPLWRVMD
jgi:hypothetical protein